MEEIVKAFVTELAKRDYKALEEKLQNMSYENAFKALDGFNLSAEPTTIKGVLLSVEQFFDFNFGCLNGTIFRTNDNKCEVGERLAVWLDDFSTPIAEVYVNSIGEVEVTNVWLV